MFKLESHLITNLQQILQTNDKPFCQLTLAFEFDYQAGRVDVVATNFAGELIGFEAKLNRWRTAVHQAYRNTSFTHYSYVVLPEPVAQRALRWRFEFERRGIGLCSINFDEITVMIPALRKTPLQPWLTDCAVEYINGQRSQSSILGVPSWHPTAPYTLPLRTNFLELPD
jgi:hypothetical protein